VSLRAIKNPAVADGVVYVRSCQEINSDSQLPLLFTHVEISHLPVDDGCKSETGVKLDPAYLAVEFIVH